ncbi:hypothetical protein QFC22_003806 [Naganishia vaughanmartiniae]|uniref:Uncharacterized protein n=1 Tax=Naganishia vaughanmartiniae TaxID=1424756 RepID=A0ACC2X6A8_9TREE|nr:hypothetical protein QFC22_003806 [Naganishia vaughanmartiniae]
MAEWSSSPERPVTQARQVPSTSAAPRSRYLTRSATRKGTTNISHILLEQRPATVRSSKSSNTTLAKVGGGPKTRKPFIEALNRAAGQGDKEDNNGSATIQQDDKEEKASFSPVKPLLADRKRRSSAFTSSPRGLENSPNTRPRKVARIPQLSAIRLSPFKPTIIRPVIRSDASSSSDVPKVEAESFTNPSTSSSIISPLLPSVDQPAPSIKIESPAKVPVGSSTPFRYGTNRILDVPLSAVKKGARWSLASDLSDDSLLLQASPKKPAEQGRLLSRNSGDTRNARSPEARQRLFPLGFGRREDLELGFLEEETADNIQVNTEDPSERQNSSRNISNSLLSSISKVSLDRQRKSAPTQKTSAARIVQRAQKSLSLPRTTSSYAKPTQSSAKAASITAANINARTALENVIRRPAGKAVSTPVAEVAASISTAPFSRPCGKQSRASGTSYLGDATLVGSSMDIAGAGNATISPGKPLVKPVARIPPNMEHRSPQKPPLTLGRAAPHPATNTTLQPARNHARRKSLTMETSKSLYGLSAALAKLTVKRPSLEGKSGDTSISSDSTLMKETGAAARSTTNTSETMKPTGSIADTATRKPAQPIPISRIPKSISVQGRNSLTRLAEVNRRISGEMQQPADENLALPTGKETATQVSSVKPKVARGIFHGVTVFVDVRTAEGDDSSAVFVEMLRAGGAKVLSKPTDNCTHVVFKSGKASTLIWWRKQPLPKPHIVGIGWVTRSNELGQRAAEGTFQVDVTAQAVFQKVC